MKTITMTDGQFAVLKTLIEFHLGSDEPDQGFYDEDDFLSLSRVVKAAEIGNIAPLVIESKELLADWAKRRP